MPDLQHTTEQNKLFIAALLSGYTSFQKLRNMVELELGDPLHDVGDGLSKSDGVAELVRWAKAEGRTGDLSAALRRDRPQNDAVILYGNSLAGILPASQKLAARDFQYVASKAEWSAKASGFEALAQPSSRLVPADEWASAMKRAQAKVCLIETDAGPVGTGFLVGYDLILTNCHVYRQIENSEAFARFDYYSSQANRVGHAILKQKLAVSTEDLLDFALLRLDSKVDGGRGKLSPAKQDFEIGQTLLILQHAKGGPLQIGIGRVMAVLPTRVVYDANTEPGSSGAPVFNMNWELVGIHHYGDPRNNSGIPIAPIWNLLAADGHV